MRRVDRASDEAIQIPECPSRAGDRTNHLGKPCKRAARLLSPNGT